MRLDSDNGTDNHLTVMVNMMKVIQLSATDRVGGAGIAAYRLHQGLQSIGIDSHMLVMRKATTDSTVHRLSDYFDRVARMRRRLAQRSHKRALIHNPRQQDSAYWSLNHQPYPIAEVVNTLQADVVHLHWTGDNFLPIQELARIHAPIVWTLHDMWAFTGGCHYAGDCMRYQTDCGSCPQLLHPKPKDITHQIYQQKTQSWTNQAMHIISPSRWLATCARDSRILGDKTIQVIPNAIDTNLFKPIDRHSARTAFNLPHDKKLVLFGAFGGTQDPRKGFDYLRTALQHLPEDNDIELVVFGADQPQDLGVNLPVHQVGRLQDSVSMVLLYSACDVFVLPSMQDNLPNTLLEALACGTPCVGFDTGGVADLIQHQTNGYLATLRDTDELVNGIQWILSQEFSAEAIHTDVVKRYDMRHVAELHHQLYTQAQL
jgi:glycosyltransferase involved in cell wall biosynthesis